MNRKQWLRAGIVLVLMVVGVLFFLKAKSNVPLTAPTPSPAELVYCSNEERRPCVVSFSIDDWGDMLVNLLLPQADFPAFSLVIVRGETETSYVCQRLRYASDAAYCAGPPQPLGESLTLRLMDEKDQTLLAQGNLTIIGLAFPTLSVVSTLPLQQTTIPHPAPLSTDLPMPTSYPPPSYP